MAELTTSTLLFTHLVASTNLRARLGDDAADLVHADHDRVLRAALGTTGGREVKTLGDGLMAAVIDPQVVAPIHAMGEELAWWQGRLEDGLGLVLEGIKLVEGNEDWSYNLALFTVGLAILAELTKEQPDKRSEWHDEAGRIWDRAAPAPRQSPDVPAQVAQCRAELARVEGRAAPGLWGDAAALWDAIPQPYEGAYARFRLAEALADAARPVDAEGPLDEALTAHADWEHDRWRA